VRTIPPLRNGARVERKNQFASEVGGIRTREGAGRANPRAQLSLYMTKKSLGQSGRSTSTSGRDEAGWRKGRRVAIHNTFRNEESELATGFDGRGCARGRIKGRVGAKNVCPWRGSVKGYS